MSLPHLTLVPWKGHSGPVSPLTSNDQLGSTSESQVEVHLNGTVINTWFILLNAEDFQGQTMSLKPAGKLAYVLVLWALTDTGGCLPFLPWVPVKFVFHSFH